MPLVSVFGRDDGKSFNELVKDADKEHIATRKDRAASYKAFRDEAVANGQVLTPEDLHNQRMTLTDGDSIMASYLGDKASDEAHAIRDSERIAARVLGEATTTMQAQATQQKLMEDTVDPDDENFETYSKRVHEKNGVVYVPGKMDPKVDSIFKATGMDKTKWIDRRVDARKKRIAEVAGSEHFKANIDTDLDIERTYEGEKKWFIDGLKQANKLKQDIRKKSTMETALTAAASYKIDDLAKRSDRDLEFEATAFLQRYFINLPGGVPTGQAWEVAVAKVIESFKRHRDTKLRVQHEAKTQDFVSKWNGNAQISAIYATSGNVPSGTFNMQILQSLANQVATQAGLPEFDWKGDGMQRFEAIIGKGEFNKLMKILGHKKDMASVALITRNVQEQVKQEQVSNNNKRIAVVAQAAERNKDVWNNPDSPAYLAIKQITDIFHVPEEKMSVLAKDIEDAQIAHPKEDAVVLARRILQTDKWEGLQKWGAYVRSQTNRKTKHILVGQNADPIAQTNNYIEKTEKHLNTLVDKVIDGPANAYRPNVHQDGTGMWVATGEFSFQRILSDWNDAMDQKRDIIEKSFGERTNDFKWNRHDQMTGAFRPFIPDDPWWVERGGGEITTMKGWYKYLIEKVEIDRKRGENKLRSTVPTGEVKIPKGIVLPQIKVSLNQLDALREPAQGAGSELSALVERHQMQNINVDDGLQLKQFRNEQTKKYEIPPSFLKPPFNIVVGQISDEIITNPAVIAIAKKVAKMSLDPAEKIFANDDGKNRKEALKLLRNLIFYGAKLNDKKQPLNTVNHPFYKDSSLTSGWGNSSFRIMNDLDKWGGIYGQDLDTVIKGESNFFNQILDLGHSHLQKDDN